VDDFKKLHSGMFARKRLINRAIQLFKLGIAENNLYLGKDPRLKAAPSNTRPDAVIIFSLKVKAVSPTKATIEIIYDVTPKRSILYIDSAESRAFEGLTGELDRIIMESKL
jgi:hypothetical protein